MQKTIIIVMVILLTLGLGSAGIYFALNADDDSEEAVETSQTSTNTNNSTENTSESNQNTSETDDSTSSKVDIKDLAFEPSNITVKKGTTVTWTNNDTVNHTVTADSASDDSPNSGTIESGKTYSFTFNTTGTFKYACNFHPSMNGTVTVTE